MLIVTTDHIPNKEIKEVFGYVKGSTIRAKHIGNDIMASLKGLVGGEIKEYSAMLDEARQVAVTRMVQEAEGKGANAIVGFRLQTSTVMSGASEIVAYGTAIRM
ncbi:MAG: heavy metal-binding domain-containing protein [Bacillaceae bacterium]|nr:heavy metal-binding domain-containing protein [Bacillaceae bacterium]